jgi:hypothetical protein
VDLHAFPLKIAAIGYQDKSATAIDRLSFTNDATNRNDHYLFTLLSTSSILGTNKTALSQYSHDTLTAQSPTAEGVKRGCFSLSSHFSRFRTRRSSPQSITQRAGRLWLTRAMFGPTLSPSNVEGTPFLLLKKLRYPPYNYIKRLLLPLLFTTILLRIFQQITAFTSGFPLQHQPLVKVSLLSLLQGKSSFILYEQNSTQSTSLCCAQMQFFKSMITIVASVAMSATLVQAYCTFNTVCCAPAK